MNNSAVGLPAVWLFGYLTTITSFYLSFWLSDFSILLYSLGY